MFDKDDIIWTVTRSGGILHVSGVYRLITGPTLKCSAVSGYEGDEEWLRMIITKELNKQYHAGLKRHEINTPELMAYDLQDQEED
jgi:hypothetical protein